MIEAQAGGKRGLPALPGSSLRCAARAALCLVLAALLATAAGTAAAAKVHAVLIGASTYRNLSPEKSLRAPANDVRRMQAALVARGVEPADIEVYADGVEGSRGDPTAAVILKIFDALPGRVAVDDQVVIYMSGHGTQIPDDNGDEDDGLDEAFLPVDAVPPAPGAERFDMTNVIRDDRIGELIDALRRKGAHVWLVVDSCHSGTISRGANDELRAKEVNAAEFGLPLEPAATATAAAPAPKTLADMKARTATAGSFVAFYASQADEISLELAVPQGAPPERQTWVSAFTDAMVGVLQRGQVATYRDLLDETARVLRGQIPPRARQTPGHDGDALDRPLIGSAATDQAAGLSVDSNHVSGGLIAGLEPGTVVALFDRAAAAPLAHGQVVQADALGADIQPIRFPCAIKNGMPSCERRADTDEIVRARTAKVVLPVTRMILRISRPRDWPGHPPVTDRGAIEAAALARIAADAAYAIDDARPDFVWYRTPEGARFMPSWTPPDAEEFGPAAAFATGDAEDAATRVMAALDRARLLMRLERVRAALPSNGLPIGVATATTSLVRYERDAAGRCRFSGRRTALAQTAAVDTCDGATVEVRNGGTTPVHVYVFALDDSWVLHPLDNACRQGAQNRVEIGGTRTVNLQYRNGSIAPGLAPRTRNGVLVFAVPFEPGIALPLDPCRFVRSTADGTRSADSQDDPVDAILVVRTDTRNAGRPSSIGQLVMAVETWPVDQGRRK